jgi:hypothetical protein
MSYTIGSQKEYQMIQPGEAKDRATTLGGSQSRIARDAVREVPAGSRPDDPKIPTTEEKLNDPVPSQETGSLSSSSVNSTP